MSAQVSSITFARLGISKNFSFESVMEVHTTVNFLVTSLHYPSPKDWILENETSLGASEEERKVSLLLSMEYS